MPRLIGDSGWMRHSQFEREAGQGPSTSVQLPLSANEWVTLNGPFALTETAWWQLLRVLDVMKPGLV
jgi:hypothetical protein